MSKRRLIASVVIFIALTLVDLFIVDVKITVKSILSNLGIALLFLAGMYAEEWIHSYKSKKKVR